ncbi:hypothetical protein BJ742DRAFT_799014, partial [Cladochytrium replicatum]
RETAGGFYWYSIDKVVLVSPVPPPKTPEPLWAPPKRSAPPEQALPTKLSSADHGTSSLLSVPVAPSPPIPQTSRHFHPGSSSTRPSTSSGAYAPSKSLSDLSRFRVSGLAPPLDSVLPKLPLRLARLASRVTVMAQPEPPLSLRPRRSRCCPLPLALRSLAFPCDPRPAFPLLHIITSLFPDHGPCKAPQPKLHSGYIIKILLK